IGRENLNPAEPAPQPDAHGPKDRSLVSRSRVALQFILPLGAALLVTTLFFVYWNYKSSSRDKRPSIRAIAVLPFQSIGLPERDSYLGLGLADALISRL